MRLLLRLWNDSIGFCWTIKPYSQAPSVHLLPSVHLSLHPAEILLTAPLDRSSGTMCMFDVDDLIVFTGGHWKGELLRRDIHFPHLLYSPPKFDDNVMIHLNETAAVIQVTQDDLAVHRCGSISHSSKLSYSTTTPPFQAKQACRFLVLQHLLPLQYRAVLLTKLHCTGVAGKCCSAVMSLHCRF